MKRKIHIVTFERVFKQHKYRLFLNSELEKGYSLKVHIKDLDNHLTDCRQDYSFPTIDEVILFLKNYNVELTIDRLLCGVKYRLLEEYGLSGRSRVNWDRYSIQMAVLIDNKIVKFNKSTGLFEFYRIYEKEQV